MQTRILSTRASGSKRQAAAAIASSASNSTIGQRTAPERLDGRLGDRELGEELGRHPGRRLVAGEEVVAERLDHPVRGAADVRGALLAEQVQELVAQPRDARQVDAVPAEDRRSRRVVRAEQLVRGVDEVELHARVAGPGQPAPDSTRRAQSLQVGLEDRGEDRVLDPGAEVREDRRAEGLDPADDRRRAVGARLEGEDAADPVNAPSCWTAKRVGGSNSVTVTGSVVVMPRMRTVASPRVPTPIGAGVSSRTDFISAIQRGWPSMSARTAQTRSIGASMTTRLSIGGTVVVVDLGRAASRSATQPDGEPTSASRSTQRITASPSATS